MIELGCCSNCSETLKRQHHFECQFQCKCKPFDSIRKLEEAQANYSKLDQIKKNATIKARLKISSKELIFKRTRCKEPKTTTSAHAAAPVPHSKRGPKFEPPHDSQANQLSYSHQPFASKLWSTLSRVTLTTLIGCFAVLCIQQVHASSTTGVNPNSSNVRNRADYIPTSLLLTPDARACITATYLCLFIVNNTWLDCNLLDTLCNNSSLQPILALTPIDKTTTTASIATLSDSKELTKQLQNLLISNESAELAKLDDLGQLLLLTTQSHQSKGPAASWFNAGPTTQTRPLASGIGGDGYSAQPANSQYLRPRQMAAREAGGPQRIEAKQQNTEAWSGIDSDNLAISETDQMSKPNDALQYHDGRLFGSQYLANLRRLTGGSLDLVQSSNNHNKPQQTNGPELTTTSQQQQQSTATTKLQPTANANETMTTTMQQQQQQQQTSKDKMSQDTNWLADTSGQSGFLGGQVQSGFNTAGSEGSTLAGSSDSVPQLSHSTGSIFPTWLGRPLRAWSSYSFWSSQNNPQQIDNDTEGHNQYPSELGGSASNVKLSGVQILRPIDKNEHINIIEVTSNQSNQMDSPSQQFQMQQQQSSTEEHHSYPLVQHQLNNQDQLAIDKSVNHQNQNQQQQQQQSTSEPTSLAGTFVLGQEAQASALNQVIVGSLNKQAQSQLNQPAQLKSHTSHSGLVSGLFIESPSDQQHLSSASLITLKPQELKTSTTVAKNGYENSIVCRCDDILASSLGPRQDIIIPELMAPISSHINILTPGTNGCRLRCLQQQLKIQSDSADQNEPDISITEMQELENSMGGSSTEPTQVPYPTAANGFNQQPFSGSGANGNSVSSATGIAGAGTGTGAGTGPTSKVPPLEVSFLLYTRYHRDLANDLAHLIGAGPHNLASIAVNNLVTTGEVVDLNETTMGESRLNASLPIKIVIHGFGSGGRKPWVADMVYKLLEYEDVNVIVVDWEKGAALPNYVQAAGNTRFVGHKIATLIKMINARYGLTGNSYHLIGFSLGAHVAGFAGMEVRNSTLMPRSWINRITGLDPASPLFEGYEASERLDPSDAQFVDVIHSNGDGVLRGGFGSLQPMGHVDFYPNGGRVQVGCNSVILSALSDIIYGKWQSLCNHRRALNFFMDSFEFTKCRFRSFNCESYESFLKGECFDCGPNNEKCSNMGYLSNYSKGRGKMYLTTHEEAPFCANQLLIRIIGTKGYKTNWGKVEVTLVSIDGKNETFWLSSSMNQPTSHEGSSGSQRDNNQINLQSLIVTHSSLVNFTQIYLRYTRYKGWIYSGDESWSIDKVSLMDSDGQMKSYCGYNTILESHVTSRLNLEPGNCTITEPVGDRSSLNVNVSTGLQQATLSPKQQSQQSTQHNRAQAEQQQQQQTPQQASQHGHGIHNQLVGGSQSVNNGVANGRTARLIAAILDQTSQQQLMAMQPQFSFPFQLNGGNGFQRIMPVISDRQQQQQQQQQQLAKQLQNQLTTEFLGQSFG